MTKNINTTLGSKSELISLFKSDQNAAFKLLYGNYRKQFVLDLLMNNSGMNREEVVDVFQDSLLVLYDNINQEKIETLENPYAYLKRIGQLIIYEKLRTKKKESLLRQEIAKDKSNEIDLNAFYNLNNKETKPQLKKALAQLGERCRNLIIAFYIKNQNLEEIATNYNYSNANTVKSQKHKCIKQLRNLFNESGR